MTKERELLGRALTALYRQQDIPAVRTLIKEIDAHLASEKGKQEEEPVAWWNGITPEMSEEEFWRARCIHWSIASAKTEDCDIPLFLHPSPQAEQRKPLTDAEIEEERAKLFSCHSAFEYGVRFAEKHHGIGGGDE